MLNTNQLSHLEETKNELETKQLILKTAIDIQALLRILVDKEIISKNEVDHYRNEVRRSPKYANAIEYIEQTLIEIQYYEKDPTTQLKELMRRKMEG